jgi:hypothetical protein
MDMIFQVGQQGIPGVTALIEDIIVGFGKTRFESQLSPIYWRRRDNCDVGRNH